MKLWIIALILAVSNSVGLLSAAEEILLESPGRIECFEIWEAAFSPSESESNPYNPAEASFEAVVSLPRGGTSVVPAFYAVSHQRYLGSTGNEQLKPLGKGSWRIRFCPARAGRYRVALMDREKKIVGKTFFQASAPEQKKKGFLRANPHLPGRFAFTTGEGFFALGHNLCWVRREKGTYGFDRYFRKMSAAGENYCRIWLCTWGISIDTDKPFDVDQEDAWRLDHILAAAQRQGIYVKLCIDNFFDLVNNWDKSPFAEENGGPCARRTDFFLDKKSGVQYRARLRYLIARYSAYRSLMAWELFNEMDYSLSGMPELSGTTAERLRDTWFLPWTGFAAAAVKEMDPHSHMVTTSLGLHAVWPELWNMKDIDFVQYHSYIHYLDILRTELENDAAGFALHGQKQVDAFGKPFFVAEYGYMGLGETSEMNPKDPGGIALHNSLWASTFSGAAGTPMLWWWDNYIESHNLYTHYHALSEFTKSINWAERFVPMRIEDGAIRVMALRGQKETFLWVQNLQNTWGNRIVKGQTPEEQNDLVLRFKDFPPGVYTVTWYDPYKRVWHKSKRVEAPDGMLKLTVPPFTNDIAVRLFRR